MKLASLFDGIGGALLCAQRCGIEAVWSSEIEPFPIKVTEYHFPHVKHLGDITKINGAEAEPVDIIIGGSPCQDLSVAGLRKGMKHSDFGDEETTRSGLFMEQIRIVKEMRNATGTAYPRYMVWENVPGAFSSNNGDDFRAVLEETARIADSSISIPRSPNGWANAGSILGDGFSISWRTIDAQYFGVPQRRRRIYLVADFGGQSAPKILFERESLRGNSTQSGTERKRAAGNVEDGADATVLYQPKSALEENWAESPVKNALRAEESKSSHAIVQPVICLQGNGIDRADTAGCNGKGRTEDVCYTLNTIDRPAVCFEPRSPDGYPRISNDGLCPTLNTMAGGQRQPCIAQEIAATLDCSYADKMGLDNQHVNAGCPNFVKTANTVRRLTPLECERLQGYPDNYTNIPGASDSARYKALGNSFAVPCAEFVIRGIAETLALTEHPQYTQEVET